MKRWVRKPSGVYRLEPTPKESRLAFIFMIGGANIQKAIYYSFHAEL
jgi:hypothetical protein